MKGFISLLKGRKFKKGNIKNSLFLIKDLKEKKDIINTENDYFPKIINNSNKYQKSLDSRKMSNILKAKKTKTNNENYDDLFFYFLETPEKIDIFESSLDKNKKSNNKYGQIKAYGGKFEDGEEEDNAIYYSLDDNTYKKKINVKKIFYQELYSNLINNKIQWNNFLFSKGVFNIIYQKSRLKQKEILKYSLKYNKDYDTVIKSYDKSYTSLMLKHNWALDPKIAYNNYYKIFLKKNLSQNKENNKKININDNNYSDVVIKVDNNGQGKSLIYIGKLFNVYIDDSYKRNIKDENAVSMDIKEQKSRKEVVYNYKDLLARAKMKLKNSFSYDKRPQSNKKEKRESQVILMKKLNDNNNLTKVLNNIRKKNNSFSKKHNIPNVRNNNNYKRYNTESNVSSKPKKNIIKNNSSFNSILNLNDNTLLNKINYCLTNENKNKKKGIISRMEEYKKNIRNKKNINNSEDTQNIFSFCPNLSKPVALKESDIKINISKSLYSKIIFNKNIKNEKIENQKNEKMILNFFENNCDFYYN
jgi:hypothetical protein